MTAFLALAATGFSVLGCVAFGLAGVLAVTRSDLRHIESMLWTAMALAMVASASIILWVDWYSDGFIWTMAHVMAAQ